MAPPDRTPFRVDHLRVADRPGRRGAPRNRVPRGAPASCLVRRGRLRTAGLAHVLRQRIGGTEERPYRLSRPGELAGPVRAFRPAHHPGNGGIWVLRDSSLGGNPDSWVARARDAGDRGHPGRGDAVGDPHRCDPVHRRGAAQPAGPHRLGAETAFRTGRAGPGQRVEPLMAIFVLFGAVMALVLLNIPIAIALGVVALGSILIPGIKSKGYSKEFSAAVLSSSATLAVIIPPSIPMILYAAMADTSVVKLFVGGIIPGVLGGLLMMLIAYRFARVYNFPVEEKFRWSRVWAAFKDASWALILPAIILGGIFGG